MTQTQARIRRDERAIIEEALLLERLVRRQGVSEAEARMLVREHKQGRMAAIDPVMLEGLETI
jgi:hypothetical protein